MGCAGSKEAKDNGGAKPAKQVNDAKPEKPVEKPSAGASEAKATDDKKKEPPAERVIPQGEPIKLDELDEDFILFEPIEDHYELGEEIGKCVFPSSPD
jgi:hypothetical protein